MGVVGDINARNIDGRTAMALACRAGLREVVIECLRFGASLTEEPDNMQNSLLHAACAGNQGEMAIFLINNGSSPGGRGIFPNKEGKCHVCLVCLCGLCCLAVEFYTHRPPSVHFSVAVTPRAFAI